MHRIRPRRSGLEWQESMWNRVELGRANDERRQSLGASPSCPPKERSETGHARVLPSCPTRFTMRPQDASLPVEQRDAPTRVRLEKGPSRVKGNFHARFLGGRERATACAYPV